MSLPVTDKFEKAVGSSPSSNPLVWYMGRSYGTFSAADNAQAPKLDFLEKIKSLQLTISDVITALNPFHAGK